MSTFSNVTILPSVAQGRPSFNFFSTNSSKKAVKNRLYIPDICHFFTLAKFLKNKIYTKKRLFFALNL